MIYSIDPRQNCLFDPLDEAASPRDGGAGWAGVLTRRRSAGAGFSVIPWKLQPFWLEFFGSHE
jgi:hypothetical protein